MIFPKYQRSYNHVEIMNFSSLIRSGFATRNCSLHKLSTLSLSRTTYSSESLFPKLNSTNSTLSLSRTVEWGFQRFTVRFLLCKKYSMCCQVFWQEYYKCYKHPPQTYCLLINGKEGGMGENIPPFH